MIKEKQLVKNSKTSEEKWWHVIQKLFKVAPNSFTIARALSTKAQVICARSKENVSVFRYFMTSTLTQNVKLTVNFLAFPSVNFFKIWLSCNHMQFL